MRVIEFFVRKGERKHTERMKKVSEKVQNRWEVNNFVFVWNVSGAIVINFDYEIKIT